MADRGKTFSAPMVRALLEGRKTQTRRLLIRPPETFEVDGVECEVGLYHQLGKRSRVITGRCITLQTVPDAPGDRLYVREHWKTTPAYDDLAPSDMGGEEPLLYLADGATFNWGEADGDRVGRHRQAMHMPRWASRLWLRVTDVRVQRVQDISEADAIAEGIEARGMGTLWGWIDYLETHPNLTRYFADPRRIYASLWDSLHTAPGTRWEDNPWIYADTFEVKHGNIDQMGEG